MERILAMAPRSFFPSLSVLSTLRLSRSIRALPALKNSARRSPASLGRVDFQKCPLFHKAPGASKERGIGTVSFRGGFIQLVSRCPEEAAKSIRSGAESSVIIACRKESIKRGASRPKQRKERKADTDPRIDRIARLLPLRIPGTIEPLGIRGAPCIFSGFSRGWKARINHPDEYFV